MSWTNDPTDPQMPRPTATAYIAPTERRTETVGLALIVLLTFLLGAGTLMAAVLSLNGTIDRLMAAPMCVQEKTR